MKEAIIEINGVKFSTEQPPMYQTCHDNFGADWDKGTIFAYGDVIHAKFPDRISPDVVAHEQVHFKQQERFGDKDKWWFRYLGDATFRREQEIEAYKAQIAYAEKHYNYGYRRALKKHIYESFSSLSGGTITLEQAKILLG